MTLEDIVDDIHLDLLALMGDDQYAISEWLERYNYHLSGIPQALMASEDGAADVASYLRMIRRR